MLTLIVLFILLIYSIGLLFVIGSAFWAFVVTKVPFVPTPSRDIKQLVEYLKLSQKDRVLDIGSGNGRVVFLFEELGCVKVRGIEAGRWTHYTALINKYLKKSQAEFIRGNFFKSDWSDVTVLYCYLYPPLMKRVGEKAGEEMKQGARVVSRDFPIPNLKLVETLKMDHKHEFYVYRILNDE